MSKLAASAVWVRGIAEMLAAERSVSFEASGSPSKFLVICTDMEQRQIDRRQACATTKSSLSIQTRLNAAANYRNIDRKP